MELANHLQRLCIKLYEESGEWQTNFFVNEHTAHIVERNYLAYFILTNIFIGDKRQYALFTVSLIQTLATRLKPFHFSMELRCEN